MPTAAAGQFVETATQRPLFPHSHATSVFIPTSQLLTPGSHIPEGISRAKPWFDCFPMRIPFILCYQEVRYGRILFNGFSFGHAPCRATACTHWNGFFPARFFYRPGIFTAFRPTAGAAAHR